MQGTLRVWSVGQHYFPRESAERIYTPGTARDHGYRLSLFDGDRFAGRSVLDVGAFDGFYSFLAERRGAARRRCR